MSCITTGMTCETGRVQNSADLHTRPKRSEAKGWDLFVLRCVHQRYSPATLCSYRRATPALVAELGLCAYECGYAPLYISLQTPSTDESKHPTMSAAELHSGEPISPDEPRQQTLRHSLGHIGNQVLGLAKALDGQR